MRLSREDQIEFNKKKGEILRAAVFLGETREFRSQIENLNIEKLIGSPNYRTSTDITKGQQDLDKILKVGPSGSDSESMAQYSSSNLNSSYTARQSLLSQIDQLIQKRERTIKESRSPSQRGDSNSPRYKSQAERRYGSNKYGPPQRQKSPVTGNSDQKTFLLKPSDTKFKRRIFKHLGRRVIRANDLFLSDSLNLAFREGVLPLKVPGAPKNAPSVVQQRLRSRSPGSPGGSGSGNLNQIQNLNQILSPSHSRYQKKTLITEALLQKGSAIFKDLNNLGGGGDHVSSTGGPGPPGAGRQRSRSRSAEELSRQRMQVLSSIEADLYAVNVREERLASKIEEIKDKIEALEIKKQIEEDKEVKRARRDQYLKQKIERHHEVQLQQQHQGLSANDIDSNNSKVGSGSDSNSNGQTKAVIGCASKFPMNRDHQTSQTPINNMSNSEAKYNNVNQNLYPQLNLPSVPKVAPPKWYQPPHKLKLPTKSSYSNCNESSDSHTNTNQKAAAGVAQGQGNGKIKEKRTYFSPLKRLRDESDGELGILPDSYDGVEKVRQDIKKSLRNAYGTAYRKK